MNPATRDEADKIAKGVSKAGAKFSKTMAVMCPPALYLATVAKLADKKKVFAGVQNISTEPKGSFTGEISAAMAKNAGALYAIIGHSERRKMGETNAQVNKKVHLALQNKLTPIMCIGEDTRDDEGKYLSHIKDQLKEGLVEIPEANLGKIIIAYEPVWAIGASAAMSAHEVHQMTIFITKSLMEIYKTRTRIKISVLYGGSVDPTNAFGILTEGEVDGLLVGRQSLDPAAFAEILRIANSV